MNIQIHVCLFPSHKHIHIEDTDAAPCYILTETLPLDIEREDAIDQAVEYQKQYAASMMADGNTGNYPVIILH